MRSQPVQPPAQQGPDWKGIGYLVSIVSVFFLGSIAWPGADEPKWHILALVVGMAASIIGMGCRYKSHLDEQREIKKARTEAQHS